jgi:glycosyltransferase involved in cell wall biosynthesis
VPGRPQPEPRLRRGPARDGHRGRAHRALGSRRRCRPLLARAPRRGVARGRAQRALLGQTHSLADAFLAARERDPRLHLCLAGGGPEEDALRKRLGEHASFLGWLEGDALADAYASADLFLFASRTDTFGQVLLEAQASGLPVVAVAEGGPCSIVEDGVTGRLCPPDAQALADAVVDLAAAPLDRARLAQQALETVRERTWGRALGRLAEGYRRALGERPAAGARRAA